MEHIHEVWRMTRHPYQTNTLFGESWRNIHMPSRSAPRCSQGNTSTPEGQVGSLDRFWDLDVNWFFCIGLSIKL
jgi:hypothetical protein